MCYDISFTVSIKEISDYFPELIIDDQLLLEFPEQAHIQGHAYQEHPIIFRRKGETELSIDLMQWGVIPHYVTDKEKYAPQRRTMLNIRSERILDDASSYWHKIKDKRCLIPVTGFYEHRGIDGWTKKVPYYIRLKNQKTFFLPGLFAMANLVDKSTGEVKPQFTFAVITRDANADMKLIHNCGDNSGRMPLMLPLELSQAWMNKELSEAEYRNILDFEMPSDELDYRTVYTIRTSKPRPDDLQKTDAFDWPKLPPLKAV